MLASLDSAGPPRLAPTPRRIALLLALAFAITSASLLAMPTVVRAWDAGTYSTTSEAELVSLTNKSRASAGLRALIVDSALVSLARWRSKDMAVRDYFSHTIPPNGTTVFDAMQDRGYCFKVAGENIGWNTWSDDVATQKIHEAFMDSPSHRSNILGVAWDHIGVGSYKRADGRKYWTVLFADKCSTATPRPTPKPTPKPTPRPTPKPTAKPTPKPTARPTPRPTPKPTARPTPAPTLQPRSIPTPRPATPTPTSSPVATPSPPAAETPTPTPPLTVPEPTPTPTSTVASEPGDDPPTPALGPHGLRVVDPATGTNWLDAIVAGVTEVFFGG
ncbi:MAG: CAP domain-containing protein [Chloroflexota bacterium]